MKAQIIITKSFDEPSEFTKSWCNGDFKEFLNDEGDYLDRLAKVLEEKGKDYDSFTVTYTVTLKK